MSWLDAFFQSYDQIEANGVALPQRSTLDLVGFTTADDATHGRTIVTAPPSTAYSLYGTYASRPAAGVSGRMYVSTDSPVVYIDNGTTWTPMLPGACPGVEVAPSNVSPFTFVASSALLTGTVQGGVLATYQTAAAGSAHNLQMWNHAYTPGQTVTAFFTFGSGFATGTGPRIGIYVGAGTTGGVTIALAFNTTSSFSTGFEVELDNFSNSSTLSTTITSSAGPQFNVTPTFGLKIVCDSGTTYSFWWGTDGVNWIKLGSSVNLNSYVTPSSCGFFVDPFAAASQVSATLLSWHVA